ncbi:cAAX amino terminal protease family protein [Clostridium sp. CAG:921]|nr:cAAX amino terminal protease family protein [Clostridium sp. CAG:921]
MKNNKVKNLIKYTVEKNIKNKWFIVLNIVFLIVSIVALNFNTVKNIFKSSNISGEQSKFKIELVDESGVVYKNLLDSVLTLEDYSGVELTKKDKLEYDAKSFEKNKVIVYVENSDNELIAKVISKEGIDTKYYNVIYDAISNSKNQLLMKKYGIDKEKVENILSQPKIERIMTSVDSENANSKQILQNMSNYAILLILIIVLGKIANDISQEKVSKSIEYVLTSISEKEYLISKILSVNLTILIQVMFSIVYFLIGQYVNYLLNSIFNVNSVNMVSNISRNVDMNVILYVFVVLIFLIITVFIQCAIQAALSSKTTNITESGNATILLLTINMIIYTLATITINPLKETNILINVLSFVPIFSMYFIPALMIVSNVGVVHVLCAILVNILMIPVIFNFCAKIFKKGILDYNEKSKKNNDLILDVERTENEKIKKIEFSKYGHVIGMSVIIFVVTTIVTQIVFLMFSSSLSAKFNVGITELNLIFNMISFVISLILPTIFIKTHVRKEQKKCNLKQSIIYFIMCVPIMAVIQIILGIVFEKLGLNYDVIDKANLYNFDTTFQKILSFIYIAVLPAIFEELYVRGAVLSFSKKYGEVFAVIASALLFAAIHMNISQAIFAFLAGVIFAMLTLKTNSIVPSMLLHFLNNGYSAFELIFHENKVVLTSINLIYLLLIIVGIIAIIVFLVKNRKTLCKHAIKIKNDKDIIFMFKDYTLILACILVIVMSIVTQKILIS